MDKGNLDSAASGARTEAEGDLRVWWIPQLPMKSFDVPVSSIQEARMILDVLEKYDAFQYENNIKPDYCNAGGLNVFEDGEWCDWSDEWGDDIDHAEGGRLWEPPVVLVSPPDSTEAKSTERSTAEAMPRGRE